MAKKKSAFEAMNEGKFSPEDAAKKAAEESTTKDDDKKEELPRKMVRVSPEVHAMAKKASALSGKHMQSYLEELVHKDFKAKYPELWKKTMAEIKAKYPEHYADVIAQSKHWKG